MTDTGAVIESLPPQWRDPVRSYSALVQEVAGDRLQSLALFGSIVVGGFDGRRDLIRSVMVLNDVDLGLLRHLAEHGAKLGKHRISAPLVMTPKYIQASLDVFPLELLEIQQQNATLHGEDHFANLVFEQAHVRLQCEREFKAILIGLRQGLLAAAGRDRLLGELETGVLDTLLRTMRGMLWLKNEPCAGTPGEVVAAVETQAGRELAGVRRVLNPDATHEWSEFHAFYDDVTALGELADAW